MAYSNEAEQASAQAAFEARSRFWQSLGQVDADVLTHVFNPAFHGGPAWPALRQAFQRITRDGSTLLVSDGLSDPYPAGEGPATGNGVEVLLETTDPAFTGPLHDLSRYWLFDLVYQVAQNVANAGPQVADMLQEYGVLSMSVPFDETLRELTDWVTEDGTAGLLLGAPTPSFPSHVRLPGGDVRLLPLTVLRPAELEFAMAEGARWRQELVERLASVGAYSVMRPDRASVV